VSHGVAELPPNRVDLPGRALETTLPVPRGARTVRVTARGKKLRIETVAGSFVPQLQLIRCSLARLLHHEVRPDPFKTAQSPPDPLQLGNGTPAPKISRTRGSRQPAVRGSQSSHE